MGVSGETLPDEQFSPIFKLASSRGFSFSLPLCTSQSPLTEDTALLTIAMCHYTNCVEISIFASRFLGNKRPHNLTSGGPVWRPSRSPHSFRVPTTKQGQLMHRSTQEASQVRHRYILPSDTRPLSYRLPNCKSEIQQVENRSLLAKSRATDFLHTLARPLISLKSPFTATCLGVGTC